MPKKLDFKFATNAKAFYVVYTDKGPVTVDPSDLTFNGEMQPCYGGMVWTSAKVLDGNNYTIKFFLDGYEVHIVYEGDFEISDIPDFPSPSKPSPSKWSFGSWLGLGGNR